MIDSEDSNQQKFYLIVIANLENLKLVEIQRLKSIQNAPNQSSWSNTTNQVNQQLIPRTVNQSEQNRLIHHYDWKQYAVESSTCIQFQVLQHSKSDKLPTINRRTLHSPSAVQGYWGRVRHSKRWNAKKNWNQNHHQNQSQNLIGYVVIDTIYVCSTFQSHSFIPFQSRKYRHTINHWING